MNIREFKCQGPCHAFCIVSFPLEVAEVHCWCGTANELKVKVEKKPRGKWAMAAAFAEPIQSK